ncbi:MAG: hypothetical protein KDD29_07030 [Flavobacteriales bacterium]|nr:hypothetical protein [Flavobacteriales bacterium]
MKKYTLLILLTILQVGSAIACEVCQNNQPEILKGVTHGTGPESRFDNIIIAVAIIIVLFTLYYSLKYLIKPNENNPKHIKNLILSTNDGIE